MTNIVSSAMRVVFDIFENDGSCTRVDLGGFAEVVHVEFRDEMRA